MNVSVTSLIWVSAWKMLTERPTTRPKSSTGPASSTVSSSAPRPIPITVSTPTRPPSAEALHQRAGEHVPAVDQHEQHQLERQRDDDRRQRDHPHRREDR